MQIVGYSDRLSAAPGDTIRFMVSCQDTAFQADIVRLVRNDGFEQAPSLVPAETYPGREQLIHPGSHAEIRADEAFDRIVDFTLLAWVQPTAPTTGVQGLLTHWWAPTRAGFGLFVDDGGAVELRLGDVQGCSVRISTARSLRTGRWYLVGGSFDTTTGQAHVFQEPLVNWPLDDSAVVVDRTVEIGPPAPTGTPFLVAGYSVARARGSRGVRGNYNGKIDSPRVYARALSLEEVQTVARTGDLGATTDLVAAWDFAADPGTSWISDRSPNALHGTLVNMPARAMTGWNWSGHESNFRHAPQEYGAIHFHDDDLTDPDWDVSFEFQVPVDLPSGAYAARIRSANSLDTIPFFVRPPKGTTKSAVAFLAPTFSYQAYANERLEDSVGAGKDVVYAGSQDAYRYIVDNGLLSLYNLHSDGSGACYSSRLRPNLAMRPGFRTRLNGVAHQFSADLDLIEWFAAADHEVDVITDEDLHVDGGPLIAPYRVIVTGTHPEYWSGQMLDAVTEYLNCGGRLMYLGGNGFYWVTSTAADQPHVIEVRRTAGTRAWEAGPGEYYHSTTGELGGLWRYRGRFPQRLLGVGFTAQGFDRNAPYYRTAEGHTPRVAWVFDGIVPDRDVIGNEPSRVLTHGAAGFEVDRVDYELGTPYDTLVLASSQSQDYTDSYQHVIEEVLMSDSKQGATVNPLVRADMTLLHYPNGGAVFSTSSISWCGGLSHNGWDNDVAQITDNVLRAFVTRDSLL